MPTTPPAGWYPDPSTPDTQRYWDGGAWTDHVAPLATGGGASTGVPALASFGQRLGAMVVDGLVITTPLLLVLTLLATLFGVLTRALLGGLDGGGSGVSAGLLGGGFVVFALVLLGALVVPLLYAIGFEGSPRGQTIGKWALGIRVVDGRTAGRLPTGRAAIRVLVRSFASGSLFGLGYLWMLWDEQHRAWHDLAADSRVVVADGPRVPLGQLLRSWTLRG